MNFLSHHALACQLTTDQPALFYAGNLLPDWLGISREGPLRKRHVLDKPGALAEGARLHFEADHRFHTDPVFEALCDEAKILLRALPLKRVFFFAHVAVELAMDAQLLRSETTHAEDLFTRLEACLPEIAPEAARLLEREALPGLAGVAERFVANRWVMAYATDEGLARRLSQLGMRMGIPPLEARDQLRLVEAFTLLYTKVAPETPGLISRSAPV